MVDQCDTHLCLANTKVFYVLWHVCNAAIVEDQFEDHCETDQSDLRRVESTNQIKEQDDMNQ